MSLHRFSQRGRVLLAAVAVGTLAGVAWALLSPPAYEASVTVLVAHGTRLPASSEEALQGARTVAALAESETVRTGIADSLGIAPPALDARPKESSGLVVIRVRAGSASRATRAAQQAGLVVSQLVATRLSGSGIRATIWDPAGGARSRGHSLPLAAALGALLGLAAAAFALRRPARLRRPQHDRPDAPAPVPPRADPPGAPAPAPAPAPLAPPPGADGERFRLATLEALAADAALPQADADELRAYLVAFRGEADGDGLLPASLGPVVRDVFGRLLP
jgi:hypothetical protein